MSIRRFISENNDPYHNLALEHSLLDRAAATRDDLLLRFWKNSSSVVIGRVQDLRKEVNIKYCETHNIPILRRISGGGAVYHDLGNLNTSLIFPLSLLPGHPDVQTAAAFCTNILVQVLQSLGYRVTTEADTNIFLGDQKISGSAGHLKQGWFLHHATLLLQADLGHLEGSLLARTSNPDDRKASRYFPTTNLEDLSEIDWIGRVTEIISSELNISWADDSLRADEVKYANQLHDKLYTQDQWINFGKRKLIHWNDADH